MAKLLDSPILEAWSPNQKIRALNVVGTARSFQRMILFFETETALLFAKFLNDNWIAWAGTPKELVLDPSRTNPGDPMVIPAELEKKLVLGQLQQARAGNWRNASRMAVGSTRRMSG